MITVNDVVIAEADILAEVPNHEQEANPRLAAGQELVLRELIRQRGGELDLNADGDEALLAAVLTEDVRTPQADEASCRRYYDQHPDEFREGDLIEVWHILFQATSGLDVQKLRSRANLHLAELHRQGLGAFGQFAREYSNCPSGAEGGSLGELSRGEMVPEFEKAVFALPEYTLAGELIETRFGFHIVRTGRKVEGRIVPFDEAHDRLAAWLEESSYRRAVHQYLQQLVGAAQIQGIPMQGADSPLVQ
ncbi:peptidylprolyl isomerase [Castellaniella sp.]|uniref:peptidylprolyl isomerase n=1 Tax=Castellaniella sp. TaxID=1955812 RepID=UPI002AFFEE81|nr:peptidylprolyl isomerase [Castellaniella sp.]